MTNSWRGPTTLKRQAQAICGSCSMGFCNPRRMALELVVERNVI